MSRPEILALAKLSPLFMQSLSEHFVVPECRTAQARQALQKETA